MKRALWTVVLATPAFGYNYYFSDPLTSLQSSNWYANQDAQFDSTGFHTGTGGSYSDGGLVSKIAVPDGTSEYEIKATLNGTVPSGYGDNFRILLHASSDADGYSAGTFYAIWISPASSIFSITKRVGGTLTTINSGYFPYYDGVTIRAVVRSDGQIITYVNDVSNSWTRDTDIATGKPGFFISGHSQLHISNVQLGPLDRVAPTIPSPLPTFTVFSNHVDFQWPGVYDDANGTGIGLYQFYRDFNFLANTNSQTFTDWAVTPGNIYTYTFIVYDKHWNATQVSFTVTVPVTPGSPPTPPDGRRIGIRPTGTYWGAGGENIDVLSGNVNFTIPLLKAQSRGGKSMSFAMNYNSQNWRQDSGGTWNLGYDAGVGFGWRLMAGSIQQIWDGYFNILAYKFTDSTGAEYMLNLQDPSNSDLWRSRESVHLVYQASSSLLWFPDGTFWEFGCTSNLNEPDAGIKYPTRQEDSNGNQIWIRYLAGHYSGGNNSSSRISQIEDVRAPGGNGGTTYSFNYDNSSWPPRLNSLTNTVGTPETYSFGFSPGSVQAPFSPYTNYGTTTYMWSLALSDGSRYQFANNGYGEIYDVMFPTGGHVAWDYQNVMYGNGRTYREVYQRHLNDVTHDYIYVISHGTVGTNMRPSTTIDDAGGVGHKYWAFSQSGANASMVTQYKGLSLGTVITQDDLTWAQDTDGNLYLASTTNTLDPATYAAKKKTDQTVDVYGNVTKLLQYNYGNLTVPGKIYTYNYVNSSNYLAWHMTNLLASATVGSTPANTLTLVTNTYDQANLAIALSPRANQFDTSWGFNNGALGRNERGNVSTSVTPSGTRQANYDETGSVTQITVNGVTAQVSTTSITNYSLPSQLSAAGITSSLTYNGFGGLTNESSANGYLMAVGYDTLGRPSSTTSPFGATTSTTFNPGPYLIGGTPKIATTTVNGRKTITTADWFGRPSKVETADASGTKSVAETEYAPCGCTPLGKMTRQAIPHLPGTTANWTTYTYDGIGRTVSVKAADNASLTTYQYQGNAVTVTDPANKSKTYTTDAFGQLTQVNEPNPGGGGGGNSPTWYNASWAKRKALTIDHAKVSAAVTNFAVLFSRTDADFKTIANGGGVGKSDGTDVLFTAADGVTKLDHELERYVASSGEIVTWFRLPSLSNTTDTTVYMYYGNAAAPDQQNKAGVWDVNYKGVWHLNETLTGDGQTVHDSTGTHDSIAQYNWTAGNQQTGQIGGSLTFNGGSPYQDIYAGGGGFGISTTTSSRTVSTWFKKTGTGVGVLFGYAGLTFFIDNQELWQWDSQANTKADTGVSVSLNTWNYLSVTYDGATARVYLNGSQVTLWSTATVNGYNPPIWSVDPWGYLPGYSTQGWLLGSMDESRISVIDRSAAWIATEYTNQSAPGPFYKTVGPVESYAGGGGGGGGGDYVTTYSYDLLGHLTGVSMPRPTGTQTRTFNYSGAFLLSATNPENGTVNYTYGSNQKIATKTDAKGQQTQEDVPGLVEGWKRRRRRIDRIWSPNLKP